MAGSVEVARIEAIIGANASQFERALASSESRMHRFVRNTDAGLSRSKVAWTGFDRVVSKAAIGGIVAFGAAAGVAGVKSMQLGARLEQSRVAFKTLLGDGRKAEVFLKDLQKFAATTPFEFTGLQQSARLMLAMGFNAKRVLPSLRIIGDAVGALGGGAPEIDRVVRALGQMQAKQKVSAEEMMQLSELGIGAWQMLAKEIGVSVPEAMKRAEKGMISGTVGVNAILAGMNARFAGSMEEQSKTTMGKWSNFMDTLQIRAAESGLKLIDAFDVNAKLAAATEFLGSDAFIGGLETVIDGASRAFDGLGQAVGFASRHWDELTTGASVAVPAIVALGAAVLGLTMPWTAVAAGVIGAAFALKKLYDSSATAREAVDLLWQVAQRHPLAYLIRGLDSAAQKAGGWGDVMRIAGIGFLGFTKIVLTGALNVIQAVDRMTGSWLGRFSTILNVVAKVRPEFRGVAMAVQEMSERSSSGSNAMASAIERDIAKINGNIAVLKAEINSIPTSKTVTVTMQERRAAGRGYTDQGGSPTPRPRPARDGGAIEGEGTGTSDSIPALLSDGEHVWTAREVKAAGGHGAVERMRRGVLSGRQAFARGGRVARSPLAAATLQAAIDASPIRTLRQAEKQYAAAMAAVKRIEKGGVSKSERDKHADAKRVAADRARALVAARKAVADARRSQTESANSRAQQNAIDGVGRHFEEQDALDRQQMLRAQGTETLTDDIAAIDAARSTNQKRIDMLRERIAKTKNPETKRQLQQQLNSAIEQQIGYDNQRESWSSQGGASGSDSGSQLDEARAIADQAQRRADVAAETARLSEAALGVFTGTGDIGFGGGRNAWGSARGMQPAVNVHVNSLTGYSPEIREVVGDAAGGGFTQGGNAFRSYSGRG